MPRRIDKIRESSSDELHQQERELTEQIFRLRFQLSTGQAEALKRLRDARKDLARVKTHLRAQELNLSGAHIATQKVEQPEAAAEKTAAPKKTKAQHKKPKHEKPKHATKKSKTKKAGKA
jgi:large subunit ribosomal protein L29